eukprot:TRINITY_DN14094_c0_g1_i2.p1 TRINITY_DN14094_c0_g1~~TRINITY_DN14094_c0_g1_i2.p1  ORF type:complete len:228 (-),score=44.40 TRINITY_DN14094_c0_g1_i2:902-1534(-)
MSDMQVCGSSLRPLSLKINTACGDTLSGLNCNGFLLFNIVKDRSKDLTLSCTSTEELYTRLGEEIVVCIGDTHGNLEATQDLYRNLAQIFGPLFDYLTVIFLGDICDRGTHTKELIEWAYNLPHLFPKQKISFLLGNHCYGFGQFMGVWLPTKPDMYKKTNENYFKKEPLWEGHILVISHPHLYSITAIINPVTRLFPLTIQAKFCRRFW